MSNLRKKININSAGTEVFTETNPGHVDFSSPSVDAFGRLRTSTVSVLFDSTLQYHTQNYFHWNDYTSGVGASISHLPNESSVQLQVGTVSGETAIRQSKRYVRYQPGKSQFIAISAVMGAKKSNVRQRIGYFDENNGLFFEQDGSNLKVVRRTYVTGTAVDNAVNQSSWNLDKLDGTGISGYTIDTSKTQLFVIDFQWLGVGRVRLGFDIDGDIIYCHEFLNANNLSSPYMTTGNLPIRIELTNTDTAASSTTLKQTCVSVGSESGFSDERGITHAVGNGSTSIAITTRRPLITVRMTPTYNSLTCRGELFPENIDLIASGNSIYYELVYNGTPNTTTWTSPSTNSIIQYQTDSTTLTGGEVIDAGFVASGVGTRTSVSQQLKNKLALTNSYDGTSPDTFSIVCTSIGGTPTANVNGSITLKELY